MKRWLGLLLLTAVSGCTTYEGYGYRDDGYYDDRYYDGPGYYRGSPRSDYAADGYRYGYDSYGYDGFGGYPDYVLWSGYYSVLWPVYRGYYDPFYSPGYFYGVSWYPRSYFGLHYSAYAWPYYQPYAPYRYSYQDAYFDHWGQRRGDAYDRRDQHGNIDPSRYRFGSARNEAERLANDQASRRLPGAARPGAQFQPYAARRQLTPSVPGFDTRPADLRQRPAQRERGFAPGFGSPQRGDQPQRSMLPQSPARDSRRFDRGPSESSTPRSTSPRRARGWVSGDPDRSAMTPTAPARRLGSPGAFERRVEEATPEASNRSREWTPANTAPNRLVTPSFPANDRPRTQIYRSRPPITEPTPTWERTRRPSADEVAPGPRREPEAESRNWAPPPNQPRYQRFSPAPERAYSEPNAPAPRQRSERVAPVSQPSAEPAQQRSEPAPSEPQRSARKGSSRSELGRQRDDD
jgi:hypothetical protein